MGQMRGIGRQATDRASGGPRLTEFRSVGSCPMAVCAVSLQALSGASKGVAAVCGAHDRPPARVWRLGSGCGFRSPNLLSTLMLEFWHWSLWRPQTWGLPVAAGSPPPPYGRARAASCGGNVGAGVHAEDPARRQVEDSACHRRAGRSRPHRRGAGIRPTGSRRRHARGAGRLVLPGRSRYAPGAVEASRSAHYRGRRGGQGARRRSRVPSGPDVVAVGAPSPEGGRRTTFSSGPTVRYGDRCAGVNFERGAGAARSLTSGEQGTRPSSPPTLDGGAPGADPSIPSSEGGINVRSPGADRGVAWEASPVDGRGLPAVRLTHGRPLISVPAWERDHGQAWERRSRAPE